jgi:hypothetical protein
MKEPRAKIQLNKGISRIKGILAENVGLLQSDNMALYPRMLSSSNSPPHSS